MGGSRRDDEAGSARGDAAHRALDEVWGQLSGRAVAVALVREPSRDGRGVLEADVLVAAGARREAEQALVDAGFRRRPGWGRHPHRFLVRPVAGDDGSLDWVKVDLVTDLAFGPWHQWATGTGAACLEARRTGVPPRLHPADELAALLGHALLDRSEVRDADARRLRALAPEAPVPGVLGRLLLPGPGPGWDEVRSLVDADDRAGLLALAPVLRSRLQHHRPLRAPARHLRNRSARRSRALAEALAARGPLVALVGPDGTGKTTLAAAVTTSARLPARVLYGGTYRSGTRRWPVPGVSTAAVLARLLGTRALVTWHRRRGRLVVLDRHPVEAAPTAADHLGRRAQLRRRGLAASLPHPDLLVVLDAPSAELHRRRPEHSLAHLERDRRRHLALVGRGATTLVDATSPPEVVCDRTVSLVWQRAVPTRVRPVAAPTGRR